MVADKKIKIKAIAVQSTFRCAQNIICILKCRIFSEYNYKYNYNYNAVPVEYPICLIRRQMCVLKQHWDFMLLNNFP